ncbi:MAG: Asp-tRNA(Asn)/Glu-tRNA(Gln) amidotransferase subunit GatB [Thermodesulfobacteriota bacterium]|nr:Asp-tRNA(Asn)/Glu-tRNA(Gln) amidotransferase subunit GatB [Thermodesulfobacteriota bacterium]
MKGYEAVIGLEVHAQLLTKSKIFCGCATNFGSKPNRNTCPICLGMPGTLPTFNKSALEFAIKVAIATNCKITQFGQFARKNYFYPDLPKGYQISQYELPVAKDGWIEIFDKDSKKRIGLTRIHLEEDAGKLLHDQGERSNVSYIDFNRTGVPLIEIVSEPDIRNPEEASQYLQTLRLILLYLEVCDGNMEEGSFRCDANVSVRLKGEKILGTRVELKNLNSFRFVQKALEYEIDRQIKVLEGRDTIIQETRLWDTTEDITISMRGKEEAHDYRYFPDPDLVPIVIEKKWIEKINRSIPELPLAKRARFIDEYNLPLYDAEILISSKELSDFFEACAGLYNKPKIISNWIMGELLRELNREHRKVSECPVTPLMLTSLLELIDKGLISTNIAKTVFSQMYNTGKPPVEIVKDRGLTQITDKEELEKIVIQVLDKNTDKVLEFKKGKEKLFGFFMGQIMKATSGKANPGIAKEILTEKLKN